jgi:hypothetical protein
LIPFYFEKEILVRCVKADVFPDGIEAAQAELHNITEPNSARRYFGISWGSPEGIKYYAAAEILPGEGHTQNDQIITLRKGPYASQLVKNYMENVDSLGKTFNVLLHHPDLDPNGYCLEYYLNLEDVQCMVLISEK